jgi:hypothetical protein
MLRFLLALALILTLGVAAQATSPCANGQCRRPVRTAIKSTPTLAPRARTKDAPPVEAKGEERSVVWHGRSRGREWFGRRPLFHGMGPRAWQSARYR